VNPPRDPLFHVLVTVGIAAAAGSACGKSRSTDSDEGAGGSSGTDSNGTGGSGGTIATGGAEIATGGAEIATGGAEIATGGAGIATGGTGISFGGSFGLGGEGGDSCVSTAQFWCRTYEPEPLDCECDPNAPITPEDCDGEVFRCVSYDPPLGCGCVLVTGPR